MNQKSGGGNKKHGRKKSKPAQRRYTESKRWITNKARRIAKYMKKFPNWEPILTDDVKKALKACQK